MNRTPAPSSGVLLAGLGGGFCGVVSGVLLALVAWFAFPDARPVPRPRKQPAHESPRLAAPAPAPAAAPKPPGDREASILRDVAVLAGLETRVDPVDGTTVLFELLPGYRDLGGDEEAGVARIELKARARADASLEESLETIVVEVRLDARTRTVVGARVLERVDADDVALEELIRKLHP